MSRWHLTRVGAVCLTLLVACVVVFLVASSYLQALAGLLACLLLATMVGEGLGSGWAGDQARKQEVLRGQARPRRRRWRS